MHGIQPETDGPRRIKAMGLLTEGPIAIVSPHLDDAALSCGQVLVRQPGCHVVSVFSEGRSKRLLPWDRSAGFKAGVDVMAARRQEDLAAMASVGAQAHHLGYVDGMYRAGPELRLSRFRPQAVKDRRRRVESPLLEAQIADALSDLVAALGVKVWVIPLGLEHPDHRLVARAALTTAGRHPAAEWLLYQDLPYAARPSGSVTEATQRLISQGHCLGETITLPGSGPAKRDLVCCYRSQVVALGDEVKLALSSPERYCQLVPASEPAQ